MSRSGAAPTKADPLPVVCSDLGGLLPRLGQVADVDPPDELTGGPVDVDEAVRRRDGSDELRFLHERLPLAVLLPALLDVDERDHEAWRDEVAVGDCHHGVLPTVAELHPHADAADAVRGDRSRLYHRRARNTEAAVTGSVEAAVDVPRTPAGPRVMPAKGTQAAEARDR